MRPDKRGSAASTTTLVVFALPVIWLGLIGGSCAAPGRTLIDWINAFGTAIEQPWHFSFNQYSLKAILIALAAYALCIMLYRDSQRKRRPGEEYGSAEWGNAKQIDSKYRYHDKFTVEVKQMLKQHFTAFRQFKPRQLGGFFSGQLIQTALCRVKTVRHYFSFLLNWFCSQQTGNGGETSLHRSGK